MFCFDTGFGTGLELTVVVFGSQLAFYAAKIVIRKYFFGRPI